MAIDRKVFFDNIRENLFEGVLTQRQVDGMNAVLDCWEQYHFDKDIRWLAYAMATAHHETAYVWDAIEEYGKGQGKEYGKPTGPYDEIYYGRGFVQLTWLENYQKGEQVLEGYDIECPMVQYPHRMLEVEPAALILFDGLIDGWFTGVGLPTYFNKDTEDPVNARKCVNGLDKADVIAGHYWKFKDALT